MNDSDADRGERSERTDYDYSQWGFDDSAQNAERAAQAARDDAMVNVKKGRREAIEKQLGYTDLQNPFGDKALTEKFVWEKRNEFAVATGQYEAKTKAEKLA